LKPRVGREHEFWVERWIWDWEKSCSSIRKANEDS